MKEKKSQQVRVRITESQLKNLTQYLIEHPSEFKSNSEFIRESIKEKICRKRDINSSKGRNV
jgi:Arc/MetJ-type ribon-helix-helix transcriptional regulator